MSTPPPLNGMWHVALNVRDVDRAVSFYRDVVGLTIEWQPDPDNVYLTSGRDNVALHKGEGDPARLDHIGFVVPTPDAVDRWNEWLISKGFTPEKAPRTHRDGARSLYVRDPEGTLVQFIHHPPISQAETP